MRGITKREATIPNLESAIGRLVSTNISPTMRGRLLYYDSERSYFEVIKHESNDQYAHCAGQTFWIPNYMSVTLTYLEEE
jgi:hypothetical protein